jgi:hypothetical protein
MKGQFRLSVGAVLLAALVAAAVLSATNPGFATVEASPDIEAQKIDPHLIAATEAGRSVSFLIVLEGKADLSAANAMVDQGARGRYVYDRLRAYAEMTQRPLRTYLSTRGITHTPYWAANAIEVTGDRSLIESLAARTDVRMIEPNLPSISIKQTTTRLSALRTPPELGTAQEAALHNIEWGVQNVNAPQVWAYGAGYRYRQPRYGRALGA